MKHFELVVRPPATIPWARTVWIATTAIELNGDGKMLLSPECVTPGQITNAVDELISELQELKNEAVRSLPAIAA